MRLVQMDPIWEWSGVDAIETVPMGIEADILLTYQLMDPLHK
jgi:hypothetical protein